MRWIKQKYRDQLGHEWSVRVKSTDANRTSISFSANGLRLVADGTFTDAHGDLTITRLRELFCDADRVFEYRGISWRVGYRRRKGMADHTRPAMNTWFTSQHGDVRYVHELLQFRQMEDAALSERLVAASGVVGGTAHIRWSR